MITLPMTNSIIASPVGRDYSQGATTCDKIDASLASSDSVFIVLISPLFAVEGLMSNNEFFALQLIENIPSHVWSTDPGVASPM